MREYRNDSLTSSMPKYSRITFHSMDFQASRGDR
jgi:hypothetical protein